MKQRSDFTGPSCRRCDEPVTEDMKVCTCGYPTVYMSFEERTKFEVERYRAYKQQEIPA